MQLFQHILVEHKEIGNLKLKIKVIALANKKDIEYGRILPRDEVLVMMSDNIQDLDYKIKNGRIKNQTNEKIKNSMVNSFVYMCQNYLKALKDKDLEQIKMDLMELKSGNISNDEFEQNLINNVDKGVDLAEIERIESIIESFNGE